MEKLLEIFFQIMKTFMMADCLGRFPLKQVST
jgi:hypothetical protein